MRGVRVVAASCAKIEMENSQSVVMIFLWKRAGRIEVNILVNATRPKGKRDSQGLVEAASLFHLSSYPLDSF